MTKKTKLVFLIAGLLSLCLLASCSGSNDSTETTDTDETTVETESTDSTTTADEINNTTTAEEDTEEATTAEPRFDYFAANVLENVVVDKSIYESMSFVLPSDLQVTDQSVSDYILYLRYYYRTSVSEDKTHETTKALNWGDDAYIYYRGEIDGVAFDGGSNMDSAEPYCLGLGSGEFVPGFESALIGVVPSETSKDNTVAVKLTFPSSYKEELAGKEAIFYVYVVYSVQYNLPDYNADFIENTLHYEKKTDFYASETALKVEFEEYVHDYLESSNSETIETEKTELLWTYLVEACTVSNLNESEINYYYNSYIDELQYYYQMYTQYGYSFDSLDAFCIQYMGLSSDANWKDELVKVCQNIVKKDMIAHAIAELEGMETVTDKEYEDEIAYWVDYYSSYSVTAQDVIDNMGEEYLKESAFAVKMSNFLLERCTFTFED